MLLKWDIKLIVLLLMGSGFVFQLLEGKTWTNCEFLTELQRHNVTETDIAAWYCIAEKESKLDSSLKVTMDANVGSLLTDCHTKNAFGIFQIPSVWCNDADVVENTTNQCQTHGCTSENCEVFLDEDLSNDIECIKKMHEIFTFDVWQDSTKKECSKNLTNIDVQHICDQENYKRPVAPAVIISVTASIVVILVASLIWKHWSKSLRLTSEEYKFFMYGTQPDEEANEDEDSENALTIPYNKKFEIPETDYELNKREILGSGAYGFVFKGHVRKRLVAVKSVKPYSDKHYLKSLLDEIKTMIFLGNHEHILALIGAATKDLRKGLVYAFVEYCELGSLENFLKTRREGFVNEIHNDALGPGSMKPVESSNVDVEVDVNCPNTEKPITSKDLILWCYQICKGMEYVTSKKVFHGDLATRNVLVASKSCIKISDFGLSGKIYTYTGYKTKNQEDPLPWRWMAIESLRDLKFSSQSDIWAFGVTMWEIFTLGDLPYPGLNWMANFVDQLIEGLRLGQPRFCTTEIYETMMMPCWEEKPELRISFEEMAPYFSKLLSKMSLEGYETMGGAPEGDQELKTSYGYVQIPYQQSKKDQVEESSYL